MAAWERFDRFIEKALLRQLSVREARGLVWMLGVYLAAGLTAALFWPASSGLCLVFPYMTLVFFLGRPGILALPGLLVLHTWLAPGLEETVVFAAASALGTLFALVTATRYRESRLHQLALAHSVELAREVQRSLEPARRARLGGAQVATFMRVSKGLGGDFMAMRELTPGRMSLIQGDVMGKGPQAGLLAAYLVGVYEQVVGSAAGPAAIAQALNQRLAGPVFATLLMVESDLESRHWKLCRAGHEIPLLRRADGTTLELSEGGHIPVGIDAGELYSERTLPLLPGDRLLLASDGIWDAGVTPQELARALDEGLEPLEARLARLEPPDDISLALISIIEAPASSD